MKAVITVTGKDNVGIIAGVSTLCAEKGVNILSFPGSAYDAAITLHSLL